MQATIEKVLRGRMLATIGNVETSWNPSYDVDGKHNFAKCSVVGTGEDLDRFPNDEEIAAIAAAEVAMIAE